MERPAPFALETLVLPLVDILGTGNAISNVPPFGRTTEPRSLNVAGAESLAQE